MHVADILRMADLHQLADPSAVQKALKTHEEGGIAQNVTHQHVNALFLGVACKAHAFLCRCACGLFEQDLVALFDRRHCGCNVISVHRANKARVSHLRLCKQRLPIGIGLLHRETVLVADVISSCLDRLCNRNHLVVVVVLCHVIGIGLTSRSRADQNHRQLFLFHLAILLFSFCLCSPHGHPTMTSPLASSISKISSPTDGRRIVPFSGFFTLTTCDVTVASTSDRSKERSVSTISQSISVKFLQ